jgi:F0F1-type ATP synthase assembly protein I
MADEPPGWSTWLGLGAVSMAVLAAGIALGWWLDSLFHTSPVFVLVGIALGIAAGMGYTVVQIRSFLRQ